MIAFLVGLIGVLVGWMLKTLTDLMAERRANTRADVIWRRQHYVDAVATLIHAGRGLMASDSELARAIYALSNAQSAGNQAIIEACAAQHRTA